MLICRAERSNEVREAILIAESKHPYPTTPPEGRHISSPASAAPQVPQN